MSSRLHYNRETDPKLIFCKSKSVTPRRAPVWVGEAEPFFLMDLYLDPWARLKRRLDHLGRPKGSLAKDQRNISILVFGDKIL